MNYKTVMILAGGKGTRFKEKTKEIPKPMVLVNEKPLLLHIMEIYLKHNIQNFIILAGYKKDVIIEYFNSTSVRVSKSEYIYKSNNGNTITILDTGDETLTGGRIKLGLEYVDENHLYITYGDGLANVNITELTKFHNNHKKIATLTAVKPPPRFGNIKIKNNTVVEFEEKNLMFENWINGGFFVVNKSIKNYISSLNQPFEGEPLKSLALESELMAYKHRQLFRPVDTIHELQLLEEDLSKDLFQLR